MLKNDYFQKGGHDPAILAQIRDLEFEAQRMQAVQRPAPPPGKEHSLTDNGVCDFYYMQTVYTWTGSEINFLIRAPTGD